MEFLHSFFLRRHFAGEPAVESRSVGCFLKLLKIQANFMLVVTIDVSCERSVKPRTLCYQYFTTQILPQIRDHSYYLQ